MDRVSTLLKKLQKQFDENSPAEAMLQTTQILQAELLKNANKEGTISTTTRISVLMPQVIFDQKIIFSEENGANEEKVIKILQVDEKEIEAELEEIKKNAEMANSRRSMNRPTFMYDPEDLPTLAHQDQPEKKISPDDLSFEYPESLNDQLKETKIELSQSLTSTPIKDLKKGIGVNDRFLFINELFRGDEAMYERSIKTIQSFSIYAEAEFWIRRELKVKIGWRDNHPVVKQFDQLVKRRFA